MIVNNCYSSGYVGPQGSGFGGIESLAIDPVTKYDNCVREIKGIYVSGRIHDLKDRSVSGTDENNFFYRAGGGLTMQYKWGEDETYNDRNVVFKNSYDLSGGNWNDASAVEYGLPTSAYESRIAGRPWKLKWEPKIDPNEYIEINQAWVDSNEYPYYLSKNAKLVEDISFSWEDQFFIFFEEGLTFDGCGNKIIINRNIKFFEYIIKL